MSSRPRQLSGLEAPTHGQEELALSFKTETDLFPDGCYPVEELGGKGAGLFFLTELGLNVPPAFVLSTETGRRLREDSSNTWDIVQKEIEDDLRWLEEKTGCGLGDSQNPLFLSVRSGAPVSMPGMMETFLNVGINDKTVEVLAKQIGEIEAWRCYFNLIRQFTLSIYKFSEENFPSIGENPTIKELKEAVNLAKKMLQEAGSPFPDDPKEQLYQAVQAVFRSWDDPKVQEYRQTFGIPDMLGTACIVQQMVYGNVEGGGAGVLFSCGPDGSPVITFAPGQQGTAVVGEQVYPSQRLEEADLPPTVKEQLEKGINTINTSALFAGRPVEIEFTVGHNHTVYFLQIREAAANPLALFGGLKERVQNGQLTLDEALRVIKTSQLETLLVPTVDPQAAIDAENKGRLITKGLSLTSFSKTGLVVTDWRENTQTSEPIIYFGPVTKEMLTNPPPNLVGIVATNLGIGSHLAQTLARLGQQKDLAVVLNFDGNYENIINKISQPDRTITIDGINGRIFLGSLPLQSVGLKEEERSMVEYWLARKKGNPWRYLPGVDEEIFSNKLVDGQNVVTGYSAHKAKEVAVANAILPQEILMQYEIFPPSEPEKIRARLKEIINEGFDASIRTCHQPFLPAGGPWRVFSSVEEVDQFFSEGGYDEILAQKDGASVAEILVGTVPKGKLDESLQPEHGVFTLSVGRNNEIILQIRPRTAHLRSLDAQNGGRKRQDCVRVIFSYQPFEKGYLPTQIIIGEKLKEDSEGLEIVNYIFQNVWRWLREYNLPTLLAAINKIFPSPTYTPTVLEGQARVGKSPWIHIYGIKADPA